VTTALVHDYRPRGNAIEILNRRDDELLVSGPAGTGKSRGCLEKIHFMCLMNPGMRALMVRRTHASLTSTALVTWREHVAPESLSVGDVWFYGGSSEEPPQYRYKNGSSINVGGMDKSTRIMSSEYDIIYVQEATELTVEHWEALTTRLRNGKVSFQQLLADCNPDSQFHWLKLRCDEGRTSLLESRHVDNPVLFNEDGTKTPKGVSYMGKLDRLSGARKKRLRDGLWVSAEGQIYDGYDPFIHLIDRFEIPQEWTRWWAVDFGYTNPFVLQCWAEDPDGRLYLYREIYMTRRTVDLHAKRILQEVKDENGNWKEPRPTAVVCDHDAEGRAVLDRELGMTTTNAHKSVLEGIQAVEKRFRNRDDGKPGIFILRDSLVERDQELVDAKKPTCTAEELPGYIWDTGAGKKIKEQPLKENDHGCDCTRYTVAERDLRGRPRVRMM
jgi:PBSX family phage terminase large subunit